MNVVGCGRVGGCGGRGSGCGGGYDGCSDDGGWGCGQDKSHHKFYHYQHRKYNH